MQALIRQAGAVVLKPFVGVFVTGYMGAGRGEGDCPDHAFGGIAGEIMIRGTYGRSAPEKIYKRRGELDEGDS